MALCQENEKQEWLNTKEIWGNEYGYGVSPLLVTKIIVVSDYKSVASFSSSLIQIIWVRIVLKFYFSLFVSFLIKKNIL